MTKFSGLGMNLGNLPLLSAARTRSISPENFTGEKGEGGKATEGTGAEHARDLGRGWKVSPSVDVDGGETFTLADVDGPGAIQHIWMVTSAQKWRGLILRIFWDDQPLPSVEVPLGDFFANGWDTFATVNSLAVCVNPGRGFNCYWEMPFRKKCRMTIENRNADAATVYYQINYTLTEVPENAAYFHAQFRRVNPLPYGEVYTILDGVSGHGQYVGTYMAWGVNNSGWWGEGELKIFLDGDEEFPTICGTGTEDYFCGGYNFDPGSMDARQPKAYAPYSTAYAGLPQVIKPDGLYNSQQRFGLYRWHIVDPIRFEMDVRITVQALGWRNEPNRRYLPLQDDISSVAFWYQSLPTVPFPDFPSADYLDVI